MKQYISFISELFSVKTFHAVAPLRCTTLNTDVNTVCHLLELLAAHPILHVSRIRVNPYPTNVENRVSS